jgi:Xaa-Pro aminopeptidase
MAAEHEVFGKLRGSMKEAGFDALVAFSPDNVTYTAGFVVPSQLSNRFRRTITVLAAGGFAAQVVVNVEEKLAVEQSRFSRVVPYNQFTDHPADVLADLLEEAGAGQGRIGIELDYMPADDYLRLAQRLPGAAFTGCKDLYFHARMVKTDEEVAILRRAGVLTERVMGEVIAAIRPGMTEKEVGRRIVDGILAAGCDGLKYQVGSGIRSGIVNCKPTDKAIAKGDVVRLEVLAELDNYRSNVTRTVVMGRPTAEQQGLWRVLIGARDACRALLRPGTPVRQLYRTYVEVCRQGGIEPTLKFLGHGIGQTIHEEPYLTDSRDIVLEPNITHTMEPLYMIPGRMGFHVEDMYVITAAGHDAITGDLLPNDDLIEAGG